MLSRPDEGLDFRTLVEGDERLTTRVDPEAVFDLSAYTAHVPAVFERLLALTRDPEAAHV